MRTVIFGIFSCAIAVFVLLPLGCEEEDGDADFSCAEKACVNDDGNTHTDCPCDADYCVPDMSGIEYANLTPLTCTAQNCTMGDASTCPPGFSCKEIPDFVITMGTEEGLVLPKYMCGKD